MHRLIGIRSLAPAVLAVGAVAFLVFAPVRQTSAVETCDPTGAIGIDGYLDLAASAVKVARDKQEQQLMKLEFLLAALNMMEEKSKEYLVRLMAKLKLEKPNLQDFRN